jgi:hypothetical protein
MNILLLDENSDSILFDDLEETINVEMYDLDMQDYLRDRRERHVSL